MSNNSSPGASPVYYVKKRQSVDVMKMGYMRDREGKIFEEGEE